MSLIPDVPPAIVFIHLAALAVLVTHTIVVNQRQRAFRRQNRLEAQNGFEL